MGLVYLVALALGGGFLAVQLLLSGHGDADLHDLSAPASGTAHDGTGGSADHPAGWLSPRFFTFAAFAFGFSGSLLHFLSLASPAVALGLSAAAGLGAGFLASGVFRELGRPDVSSSASLGEASGQLARVLLPCGPDQKGKVRVTLKGQSVDLVATAEDPIEPGSDVVVVDVKEEVARVVRAPEALRQ